jgi:hypothetical protein
MNLKRGDVREDGYRFNGYLSSGKEHWLSSTVYEKRCPATMSVEQRKKNNKKARDWYKENSDKAKAHTQKWRESNPDKIKEHKKIWMQKPENRVKHILTQAKRRAKFKNMPFDISINDLFPLPSVCPVFGIEINYEGTKAKGFVDDSPSIDRIDSAKGYIKGNVQIISWRANRIKSDASLHELEAILKYVKEKTPCN